MSLIQEQPTRNTHRIKVANATYRNINPNFRFFYIGQTDEAVHALSLCFASGTVVENFTEARTLIVAADPTAFDADVIFIDIPLNKADLEGFCAFLQEQGILSGTPLIYNKHKLDFSNIKLLRSLQLIDDVVDLTSYTIDYCSKLAFIKKVKSQIAGKVPPRTSGYGINTDAFRSYIVRYMKSGKKIVSLKRIIDILFAVSALLILSPVFVLIAIGVKLTSKGPIFYTSPRAGQGFKIFTFYKFRTMEVDADKKIDALAHLNQYVQGEAGSLFFKIANDPRITKFGMLLRNSSLDELPQLINVLKGDMSLVGNRPLPLYEAATLTTNEFVERFMAPAGITGLWQIKKRGSAEISTEERIDLDIMYARRANLLYDLRIMARTPAALWQKTNV